MGLPGEDQLEMLPGNVMGILSEFHYHPFWFIDFKEQAWVHKQASQRLAVHTTEAGKRLYGLRLYEGFFFGLQAT